MFGLRIGSCDWCWPPASCQPCPVQLYRCLACIHRLPQRGYGMWSCNRVDPRTWKANLTSGPLHLRTGYVVLTVSGNPSEQSAHVCLQLILLSAVCGYLWTSLVNGNCGGQLIYGTVDKFDLSTDAIRRQVPRPQSKQSAR